MIFSFVTKRVFIASVFFQVSLLSCLFHAMLSLVYYVCSILLDLYYYALSKATYS